MHKPVMWNSNLKSVYKSLDFMRKSHKLFTLVQPRQDMERMNKMSRRDKFFSNQMNFKSTSKYYNTRFISHSQTIQMYFTTPAT